MNISRLVVACALLALVSPLAAQTSYPVYDYVLDYDVPEAPAFAALGVTPSNVLRGSASKPVMVSILNQALTRGRLESGVALDFIPYFVLGGGYQSLDDYYARGRFNRTLSRTSLSLATVRGEGDTTSTRAAVGLRINFKDPRDLLQNRTLAQQLANDIDELLADASEGDGPPPRGADAVEEVEDGDIDLSGAYSKARAAAREQPGLAIAAGYAAAATLRGSVFSADSVDDDEHRFWVAAQWSQSERVDILATLQAEDAFSSGRALNVGLAARAKTSFGGFAGELVVGEDFRVRPGLVAELRLIPRVGISASLVSEETDGEDGDTEVLRFRTHLRWNFSEPGAK